MGTVELVSAVMTGLFIAIGSLVFYVAFLISGRNPHRDESPTQAAWMTFFAGALLLFFTPIGYIIWKPELFETKSIILSADPASINDDGAFLQFTEILLVNGLPPFIVAALGLGLTVGSLLLLKGRERTLRSIRNKTGMGIAIRNYIKPWEQLLSAVKSKGYLCVRTRDKTFIAGHIDFVSTGEEADALALRDPHILPGAPGEFEETDSSANDGERVQPESRNRAQTGESKISELSAISQSPEPISETLDHFIAQNPCRRDITVIGENAEIREIQIPHYSFQTNFNSLDHPSLGFFTAVAAIGILLMALSGFLTANFLGNYGQFFNLAFAYAAVAWILVAVTAILSVVAIWTSQRDNARLSSAVIFTPAPFLLALTALLAAGVTAVVFLHLFLATGLPRQVLLALGTIGALCLLAIILLGIAVRFKHYSLGEFLHEQLTTDDYPGHLSFEKLRALLTMLYLRCDFNYHNSAVAYQQATRALIDKLPSIPAHHDVALISWTP
jgi:hypothetical protein